MYCFNLRWFVPYLINILKIFEVGILGGRDWDPYNIMEDLNWMKASGLLLLLLAFTFFSVEAQAPLINPSCFIRLCISGQYFSISMALSLLASLFFPQNLFWVINPLIIIIPPFFCSPAGRRLLHFLVCLHAAAARLPGCTVIITPTSLHLQPLAAANSQEVIDGGGRYHGEEGSGSGVGSEESEDGDLEANSGDIDHELVARIT